MAEFKFIFWDEKGRDGIILTESFVSLTYKSYDDVTRTKGPFRLRIK